MRIPPTLGPDPRHRRHNSLFGQTSGAVAAKALHLPLNFLAAPGAPPKFDNS